MPELATQWRLLKARVVELAPTLPGWTGVIQAVYPGPPPNTPPGKYATIGFTGGGESGSYTQDQDPSGYEVSEVGNLHGEIGCSIGDNDPLITENLVFDALDGLLGAIVADRRLGVLPPESSLGMGVTLAPTRNRQGTGYIARFLLSYTSVT